MKMKHRSKLKSCNRIAIAAIAGLTTIAAYAGHETKEPQSKTVVLKEEDSLWHAALSGGFQSGYIFRGDNVIPGASGLFSSDLKIIGPGFAKGQSVTLDLWYATQNGEANYAGNPGLKGGLSSAANTGLSSVQTRQEQFTEGDITLTYRIELGDKFVLELGNYFSMLTYSTTTTLTAAPGRIFTANGLSSLTNHVSAGPARGEIRDQLFIGLSTNPNWFRYLVPGIKYYQTVYDNNGAPSGGYLVARLDGNFPLFKDKNGQDLASFRPYTLVSFSFLDRTQPSANFGRTYFTGWNNWEVGGEIPVHFGDHLTIAPFAGLSHKIAVPLPGTKTNEAWGGLKATIAF